MTDGVNRIGGSNYGYNPSYFRNEPKTNDEQPVVKPNVPETKEVDPNEIMNLMAAESNMFAKPVAVNYTPVELSQETKDRITASMAAFVNFVDTATAEFGDINLALGLADIQSLT